MFKNCQIIGVGVNPDEYHQIPAGCERGTSKFVLSSSSIRAFHANPDKWRTRIVAEDGAVSFWEFAGSKSTEWGNLFDCLLLTPDQFQDRYAVQPSVYLSRVLKCPSCGSVTESKTCRNCKCERVEKDVEQDWSPRSEHCVAWREEQEEAGRTIIKRGDLFAVNQAIKRFMADPDFAALVNESEHQVWISGEWHDPSGLVVPCKCLLDIVPTGTSAFHKSLADVKTTKNASVIPWEKWCHAAGYEIQAAWNYDMFHAAVPQREITNFRFLLSESEAPFVVGRRIMSIDLLDPERDMGDVASGRRQYKKMLFDYCACLRTGKWPGYDDTDEAISGWSVVTPYPFQEQARQFHPKFQFEEEPKEAEPDGEITP